MGVHDCRLEQGLGLSERLSVRSLKRRPRHEQSLQSGQQYQRLDITKGGHEPRRRTISRRGHVCRSLETTRRGDENMRLSRPECYEQVRVTSIVNGPLMNDEQKQQAEDYLKWSEEREQ